MTYKALTADITEGRATIHIVGMGDYMPAQMYSELETKNAELVKERNAYKKLTDRMSARMVNHKKVFTAREIGRAEQHLNQIKAEAVREAIDHCEESVTIIADMQRDRYETIAVCTVEELKQYAASLAKGE